jgi:pectin methylesterase-like acyl-CoA thioesterase
MLGCRASLATTFTLLVACGSKEPAQDPVLPPAALVDALSGEFPQAGATDACGDASLRMSFTVPPALGTKGKLEVRDLAQPDVPVVSIDLATGPYHAVIGGQNRQLHLPIVVDGTEVSVYLAGHPLLPNHTYFVRVEDGVFLDADGKSLGAILSREEWQFTTRAPAPAASGVLTVSGDGSADFCSVQGAIDAVPPANSERVVIQIAPGTYQEILVLLSKQMVTLRGEDRDTTIIRYPNNDNLNPGTHFRPMVNAEGSNDLVVENLTLHNSTPEGGSQAEAIRVEPGDRVVLRNATFKSRQDTLLLSGRVYVADSYVEGNVDFIWGKGTAYFARTEIKTVGRSGYEVQARNAPGQYGYVFVDSKLTADDGIVGQWLGRVDVVEYPGSQVAYVDCEMGPHVNPQGFTITPFESTPTETLRFWEHGSADPDGMPVDVSRRAAFVKQLTEEEAAPLRDPTVVLSGWDPEAVP